MRKPQQQKHNFRRQQQQQQQNSSWETGHHTIHYEDDDDNTDVQQHHSTAPTLCIPAPRNKTAAKKQHQRNNQRENTTSARGEETEVRLAPPPPRPKHKVHPSLKQRQQQRRLDDGGDNTDGHSAPPSSTSATSALPPSSSASSDTPAAAQQLQSLFATMSLEEQQKLLTSLQSQQLQQKAEHLRQEAEELERQAHLVWQQQQQQHQQQAKPAPLFPEPQHPQVPAVQSQPQPEQQQEQHHHHQQQQPPKKFIDRSTRTELIKFVQNSKRMNGMYEKWNAIDQLDEEIRNKKSPPEIKEIKKLHARAPAIQYDKWCYLFEVRERVKHLTGNSFLRELSKIFDELDELYSLRRAVFGLDDKDDNDKNNKNNNNNIKTREQNDGGGSQEVTASKNKNTKEKEPQQQQESSSADNSNNNENTTAPQDPWAYFKKHDSGFFCCKEMQQLRKLFDQISEEEQQAQQQQHSGQRRKQERVNDDDDDDDEHPAFNLINEVGKLKNIYTVNSIDSLSMAGKKSFLRQHIAEIENQYSTKLKVEVKKEKGSNHNIGNNNDNNNTTNSHTESQQQHRDQEQRVLHEHQSSSAAAASTDSTTQPESRSDETPAAKTEITPPHQNNNKNNDNNDSTKKRDDDVNDDDDDIPSNEASNTAPVSTKMPSDPLHYIEQHDHELSSSDELKDLKTVFHRVTQYQKKHKKATTKKFKQHEEVERLYKQYVENDVRRKNVDDKKQFLHDFIEDIEKTYLPPPTAEELEIKRRKKQQQIDEENEIHRESQAATEQEARNQVERCEEEERVQYLEEYFADNIRPELKRRRAREQECEKQRLDLHRQQNGGRTRIEDDEMLSRRQMTNTIISYHKDCWRQHAEEQQRLEQLKRLEEAERRRKEAEEAEKRLEEELNSIEWIPADVKPDFSHDASDDLEDDIRHHASRHPRVDERHCVRILSHCETNVDGCFFTERDGYGKKFRELLFRCESLPDVVGLEEVGCRIQKLEDFMTRLGYGFYELMSSEPESTRISDGGVYLFYLKKLYVPSAERRVEYYQRYNSQFICACLVHRFFKKSFTAVCGFYPPHPRKHYGNSIDEDPSSNFLGDALATVLDHTLGKYRDRIFFADLNARHKCFRNQKHAVILPGDPDNSSQEYLDFEEHNITKCIFSKVRYFDPPAFFMQTIDRNPKLQQLANARDNAEIDRQTIADLERFLSSPIMSEFKKRWDTLTRFNTFMDGKVSPSRMEEMIRRAQPYCLFVHFDKWRFLLKATSRLEAVLRKGNVDFKGVGRGGSGGGTVVAQLFGTVFALLGGNAGTTGGAERKADPQGGGAEIDEQTSRRFHGVCSDLISELNAIILQKVSCFASVTGTTIPLHLV